MNHAELLTALNDALDSQWGSPAIEFGDADDLIERLAAAGWRLEQESKVQEMHGALVRIALCVGTCPPDIIDIARHAIGKPSGDLCAGCQNIGHHGVCGACSRYDRNDYYYLKSAAPGGEE